MKTTLSYFTSLRNEVVGLGLVLAAWAVISVFYPAFIFPSPWEVLTNASASLPPNLFQHLVVTLYRVLIGFSVSLIVGTLLGLLAFIKKWGGQLNSLMMALQVLPGTVLCVIFLLVCGIGSATPILLIAFMALPTLAVNTFNGLYKKNQRLEEYLKTIKPRKAMIFSMVYLPALVPVLQSNLSLGLGLAIKVVVLGEFIGAQDGLGYLLNNARIFLDMKEVFFYLLVLLVFTLIVQALQSFVFSVFLKKYFYAE
jgi:ABC-type nitrate/sulfonate/bicarbonate transport system permease component